MRASNDIVAALGRYAHDKGKDHITVWNEFLRHGVDTLSFTDEELREGKWVERVARYNAINPTYSEIFRELVEKVAKNGHCDLFGGVYEEFFQSKFKASRTGQFFTPESVCDLMAKCVGYQRPSADSPREASLPKRGHAAESLRLSRRRHRRDERYDVRLELRH